MTSFAVLRACALVLSLSGASTAQSIFYVDDDAPPGGDGLAWATALHNPGDALDLAQPGDLVRVAAGVYRPDGAAGASPGDRNASFILGNSELRGGFQGLVGTGSPDDYDPVQHVTVLDGDLLGNDLPASSFARTTRSTSSRRASPPARRG